VSTRGQLATSGPKPRLSGTRLTRARRSCSWWRSCTRRVPLPEAGHRREWMEAIPSALAVWGRAARAPTPPGGALALGALPRSSPIVRFEQARQRARARRAADVPASAAGIASRFGQLFRRAPASMTGVS
jgi:hypothetical protein